MRFFRALSGFGTLGGIGPDDPRELPGGRLQDARNLAAHDGQAVQAILVGGDIAYRGAAAEYDAALAWLEELAKECGCPMERVFVIPGNHDVDRSIITSTPSVRNVQKAIADAVAWFRERGMLKAR